MIIFVGDEPSPIMKPGAMPFEGAACEDRLYDWIQRVAPVGGNEIPIVNSIDVDKLSGYTILAFIKGYPIVALGNNASKALGGVPHFKMPHPSGLNRQINNKSFINKKLKACKKYIEKYLSSRKDLR